MLHSLAALTLITVPVAPPFTGAVVISPNSIVQVVCIAPDKDPNKIDITAGTAFRIGKLFLSVNHVTSSRGVCTIGGVPISISYKSPTLDFSMLAASEGPFLQVDCGGFVKDRKYLALGYGRGRRDLTPIELTGTGETLGGQAVLSGMLAAIPGMSGGPIIDEETGKAVGTVNREDYEDGISLSVPLSATPVCGRTA